MSQKHRFSPQEEIQNKLCKQESIIIDLSKEIAELKQAKQQNEAEISGLKQEVGELKALVHSLIQHNLPETVKKNSSRLTSVQKMSATQVDKTNTMRRDLNQMLTETQESKASMENQLNEVGTNLAVNVALSKENEENAKKNLEKIHILEEKFTELQLQTTSNQQTNQQQEVPSTSAAAPSSGSNTNLDTVTRIVERHLGNYDLQLAAHDLRFQVMEQTSYDGTLIWKISDYKRRKQEAVSGRNLSLYSQPFYTSRYGYKMCTRVYLNGDGMGKNTHLSLFFVVMRGEYDAMLRWPFEYKVTLMLLDQSPRRNNLSDTFRPDPTSSSFKKPSTDMNIASGCPLFVAHNLLNGSQAQYIKDDTLFVKVRVDTTEVHSI